MIYAVDSRNRPAFQAHLERVARTETGSRIEGRRAEFCQTAVELLDSPDTQYLLGIDDFGRLTSAALLSAATGPHFLATLLPAPEEGVSTFDFGFQVAHHSRSKPQRKNKPAAKQAELVVAVLEYALALGLEEICLLRASGVTRRKQRSEAGSSDPNDRVEGLLIELSYDLADSTRSRMGVRGPVLSYAPVPPPYPANENQRVRIAFTSA